MVAISLNQLTKILSQSRIDGYFKHASNKNDIAFFSYYAWNMALSQSFYPSLQTLEVCLRNTIHESISNFLNNKRWYDDPAILATHGQIKKVKNAKATVKRRKGNVTPGRVVAELSFGFWTSLFNRRYEVILWRNIIKASFPYIPKRIRTRKNLSNRFNNIRDLRNRIFHHEPIWYKKNLRFKHKDIIEAIG